MPATYNLKLKDRVIKLRKKGWSYSQIKSVIPVSKSTLSIWLENYPLSEKRIRELRADNPRRIERYRATMAQKRQLRFDVAFEKVSIDLGSLSNRDKLIAGFALYWAEGGKTRSGSITFGNTDPSMIKSFIEWLKLLKVPASSLKVKIHMYKDMDINKTTHFWREITGINQNQFNKPYIKDSKLSDLTYKNGFGKGTCNITYNNAEFSMYVLMGVKYLRKNFGRI